MDWKKGRRCLTELKVTIEDWGSKGIRLSATESKATNKKSALSRCIRPTSHKGMILFLLVTDLASVRQGMLQGKCAMKAGAKNLLLLHLEAKRSRALPTQTWLRSRIMSWL